ncbi:glutathione S-transferase family protein [Halioxenophilus sp. WMMB6]|uniref:glutathione S-transferase family protein n=1 Tax=Halioxenophilus sp. WMMB6 TaxID=3073815 RepID=UPI00295E7AD2|nr:glutathione S-transferase family protein [Halioxenophilus sp. WMMB6]
MIKVYGFGPNFGLPDPSPFVVKVITYLKMAKLPFEYNGAGLANLRHSPRGKLPFIEDGDEVIADSSLILKYLERKYSVTLDDGLSAEQRASAFLYSKALDEFYYWIVVYSRWLADDNWPEMKIRFFGQMPRLVRSPMANIARRSVRKSLHAQGLGRFSQAELLSMAAATLQSLSTLLADKPYFFGREPSSFDAIAYGSLSAVAQSEFQGPFVEQALQHLNLLDYCDRIKAQYFTEADEAAG